jgi:diketogulonate reductase-like aldo/keto reductase
MSTPSQRTHTPATGQLPPPFLSVESSRRLRNGREMPVLGLGTWMLTSHTRDLVANALRLGYRMIDTSGDYHTQPGIATALHELAPPRDEIFVTSKVETNEDAYQSTCQQLDELGLDFLDLVLIHEAPEKGAGEDLWRGLMRARDDGKTRDIGVCSYKIAQLQQLADATGEMPAVHQIEWSPFGHSLDMLNFCNAHEIQVQAYSPLTRGQRLHDERLVSLAAKYGKTPAQLILRWNLQHGVVPLPKASRADHQLQNLEIFDFDIEAVDMSALDGLNERFSALEKLEYL